MSSRSDVAKGGIQRSGTRTLGVEDALDGREASEGPPVLGKCRRRSVPDQRNDLVCFRCFTTFQGGVAPDVCGVEFVVPAVGPGVGVDPGSPRNFAAAP